MCFKDGRRSQSQMLGLSIHRVRLDLLQGLYGGTGFVMWISVKVLQIFYVDDEVKKN